MFFSIYFTYLLGPGELFAIARSSLYRKFGVINWLDNGNWPPRFES